MPLTPSRVLVFLLAVVVSVGCSGPLSTATSAGESAQTGPAQRVDPAQWSAASARLTETSARFEFRYANPAETLYKVHLSTLADFSWDVYSNFISGSGSPLVQEGPHQIWQAYDCGATLYWRLEAVYTGGVLSGIQGPITVEC